MDHDVIDQIYEAAFLPELWPAIFDRLAARIDAEGGWLMALAPGQIRWTASEAFNGGISKWVANGWLARTDRVTKGIAMRHPGFLTEHDVYGPGEMEKDLFYRRFLWKLGLGWCAATAITAPTSDTLLVSFERRRERGLVEPEHIKFLDQLRPHIARSTLMSARLHLERARAISQVLGVIGLPALVFERGGKVLAANGLIEDLTAFIQWRAFGRAGFKDRQADHMFHQAIAAVAADQTTTIQSFAIRDARSLPARIGHVLPIRGAARDIFDRSLGVLMVTPVAPAKAPPAELLQSLFDLTAAEARVARGLAAGDSLVGIAADGGVTHNTVRAQLRAVLRKLGCERQGEVTALLNGISPPGN